jgi:hypothetical protein
MWAGSQKVRQSVVGRLNEAMSLNGSVLKKQREKRRKLYRYGRSGAVEIGAIVQIEQKTRRSFDMPPGRNRISVPFDSLEDSHRRKIPWAAMLLSRVLRGSLTDGRIELWEQTFKAE